MESEWLLLFSQELVTGPIQESHEFILYHHIYKNPFNITLLFWTVVI